MNTASANDGVPYIFSLQVIIQFHLHILADKADRLILGDRVAHDVLDLLDRNVDQPFTGCRRGYADIKVSIVVRDNVDDMQFVVEGIGQAVSLSEYLFGPFTPVYRQ